MSTRLVKAYYNLALGRPLVVIAAVAVLLAAALYQAQYFELDASAESLMLEGDENLEEYRVIRQRYGSDDVLFVTFTPDAPLFSEASLDKIDALRAELAAVDRVASVTSLLNVPLVQGEDVTFDTLRKGPPTLRDPDVTVEQARAEFLTSPIYKDLILNADADTTALLVRFRKDERFAQLFERRRELRASQDAGGLDTAGRAELAQVEQAFSQQSDRIQVQMEADIAEIRSILERYRDPPTIHLGGVPMIAVDMIDFVRSDIRTFGIGVGLFIIILLTLAFRRTRWVVIPTTICAGVVLAMVGWIGFMGWPVTVVSSNFISLVLIITLSLIVHLIVRYRELQAGNETAGQTELVEQTLRSKFKPSFFTSLTTAISFGSLMFAGIRPVMDFGLMMVCAVVAGFVFTFILFPSLLARLKPESVPQSRRDRAGTLNLGIAHVVHRHPGRTAIAFIVLTTLGIAGALQLTVENRFIDYFHEDTEIYQGMALIDRELGGTTPLDVVIDAPDNFMEDYKEARAFDAEMGLESEPTPAQGYWYNAGGIELVTEIQDYLESLDATGKILSLGTTWEVVRQLNDGEPLEPFELAILYNQAPEEIRQQLIDPYMTADGNQIRFDIRVIDSLPGLNRDRLLERIRTELPEKFDLQPEQLTLSGMLVLYNNVMQSLLHSQIVTLVVVFAAIMLMFGILYRSLRMALIGPIPTAAAASMVLGIMGWVGLPLDIMTMTIAAIAIGIGVDDTIHYVDRYRTEVNLGADNAAAAATAHHSVGRAMVYTTVIITLGFSILTLSNFMPTIYFGLLTGLAMVLALVSNLALLPVLLERLRPFGKQ
ncbi:putative RND superfamily exporter protein [Methylohalomonas lacus]|uniref:RND superfamily exporter protein n=1 Tax=Methylohalomonas lacus TaxID=398773 RepID=A0AAE3HM08_9GAMM|nr:efflux RND transporter permease subunit [Methylohalomonas lacus]MCS3902938.1 putative RND superfamily exporter protein [Methylohalomonas lacus]